MSDVTKTLSAIERGDQSAADKLPPLVYQELRKPVSAKLSKMELGQTLQPTMLVHEVYIRLVDEDQPQHRNSRGHFFWAATLPEEGDQIREIREIKSRSQHSDFRSDGLAILRSVSWDLSYRNQSRRNGECLMPVIMEVADAIMFEFNAATSS